MYHIYHIHHIHNIDVQLTVIGNHRVLGSFAAFHCHCHFHVTDTFVFTFHWNWTDSQHPFILIPALEGLTWSLSIPHCYALIPNSGFTFPLQALRTAVHSFRGHQSETAGEIIFLRVLH